MATHSYGTDLRVNTGGGLTDIAEVVSIQGPDYEVSATNATHLNSPNAFKEFVPGLIDGGELNIELRFTKAQYATFVTMLRTAYPWQIQYPDGTTASTGSKIDFTGFLTTLGGPTVGEDETINQNVTVKATGLQTFTQAT